MNYDLFNQQRIETPVTVAHNNVVSQKHYEKNKRKFGGQRRTIFEYLWNGGRLTREIGITKLKIFDPIKRVWELKKLNGVQISDAWINDSYMEWFMSPEDKIYNQQFQ